MVSLCCSRVYPRRSELARERPDYQAWSSDERQVWWYEEYEEQTWTVGWKGARTHGLGVESQSQWMWSKWAHTEIWPALFLRVWPRNPSICCSLKKAMGSQTDCILIKKGMNYWNFSILWRFPIWWENRKLGQMGQKSNVEGLDGRLNSSHFTLLVREAIYVLVRGKYRSQMVWEILIWH